MPAVRLVQFLICPSKKSDRPCDCNISPSERVSCAELHIVLFPEGIFPLAKQFWQHSGTGISSRLAERCLSLVQEDTSPPQTPTSRFPSKNKHYAARSSKSSTDYGSITSPKKTSENLGQDETVYVEERYGRNLPVASASAAKRALKRRIAGVLVRDNSSDCPGGPCAGVPEAAVGPSTRGVADVSEEDVYLFPCGMSAIWNAHELVLAVRPPAKSVCFGYAFGSSTPDMV